MSVQSSPAAYSLKNLHEDRISRKSRIDSPASSHAVVTQGTLASRRSTPGFYNLVLKELRNAREKRVPFPYFPSSRVLEAAHSSPLQKSSSAFTNTDLRDIHLAARVRRANPAPSEQAPLPGPLDDAIISRVKQSIAKISAPPTEALEPPIDPLADDRHLLDLQLREAQMIAMARQPNDHFLMSLGRLKDRADNIKRE